MRGRAELGIILRAAKALLVGASGVVDSVEIAPDRSLLLKLTLGRLSAPDVVVASRFVVGKGAVAAVRFDAVSVGGAEISQRAFAGALERARDLAAARASLGAFFGGNR